MKATLYRAALRYPHLRLHTASSGSVATLEELYLLLEDQGVRGVGEVRINIAYLNGYRQQQVLDDVRRCLRHIDLRQDAQRLLVELDPATTGSLAPTRMLLDMALHDLVARQRQQSVAQLIGAAPDAPSLGYRTNQTLFWSTREQMLEQAAAYVARGFTELKLRVGVATFDQDWARLDALRQRFGRQITLAVDVNGQWPTDLALARLRALQPFELSYVEQPIADADAHAYPALANASPIALMLDESLGNEADLQRLIDWGGKIHGHLKLVKMGGIGPTVRAARRLNAAGVPFMLGQMNEGAAATAAALHVACATRPAHAELYGADGLGNDPVLGLDYHQGLVSSQNACGLGVSFDPAQAEFIQEF